MARLHGTWLSGPWENGQCIVAMLEKVDISTLSAAKEADVDGLVKLPMVNVVMKTAGQYMWVYYALNMSLWRSQSLKGW